ncbi:MAG: universal stress protein [Luteibacter sp.]
MHATQRHGSNEKPSTAALRELAVIVTDGPSDNALARASAALARLFDGRLHIIRPLMLPMPAIHPWAIVTDPACASRCVQLRTAAAAHNAALEAVLRTEQVEADMAVLETMYEAPGVLLVAACRTMDVCIMMRPDNIPVAETTMRGYFADLLLGSGRPVVVVPPRAAPDCLLPKRVVVAWSGTAQCARAVHEAMPLLRRAEIVEILFAAAAASTNRSSITPADALATYLAHHGIDANVVQETIRHRPPAHYILAHAERTKATMIVAGGYGHGRLREWVMGSTTRLLFHDSPVPVFFSH